MRLPAVSPRRALLAFAASLGVASFAVAAQDAAERSEILRIERALVAAQSPDQILKYFDPGIVMVDMVPRNARGIDSLRANLQAQYSKIKELRGELLDISIDADDRLAFAHSTQRLEWTSVASGEKTEMIVRITDIYHRVKGKWLIVLQHVSVPFDPVSGAAILDGAPAAK
jgi:ketosteroid isomerase-like protein